ncbi:hypothetical protein OH77DRAFT_16639 [Trametes cingulata]|nr:hypothetical protein OH77DRAFT_16639 [Trametes cingulata]
MAETVEKSTTERQRMEDQLSSLRKMLEDRDQESKKLFAAKDKRINMLQQEVCGMRKALRTLEEEARTNREELDRLKETHKQARQAQDVTARKVAELDTDISRLFNVSATKQSPGQQEQHDNDDKLQGMMRQVALGVVENYLRSPAWPAQLELWRASHPADVRLPHPPPAAISHNDFTQVCSSRSFSCSHLTMILKQDNRAVQQGPMLQGYRHTNGGAREPASHHSSRGSYGERYGGASQSEQGRINDRYHRGDSRSQQYPDHDSRTGSYRYNRRDNPPDGRRRDDRDYKYGPRGDDHRRRSRSPSRTRSECGLRMADRSCSLLLASR